MPIWPWASDGRAGGTELRRAMSATRSSKRAWASEMAFPGRRCDLPTVQDHEDDERRAVAHEPAARQIAAKIR